MNRESLSVQPTAACSVCREIWYLADYVSSNQEALFNNSYNSQQRVLAQENTRGTIYAGTGEVLAQTVIAEDGTSVREYPYKNIFAHVVGYTDKGKTGIEELENYQLIHSDISDREKLDHELAGEKNPGNDVYTTLDTSLQQAASDALGLYRGAIVVTEIKTGRVLCNGQQARLRSEQNRRKLGDAQHRQGQSSTRKPWDAGTLSAWFDL